MRSGCLLAVIVAAAAYGILVGSIPGLTATMAVALIVPLTFYLSDIQAVAAIVTTVTCSIFAGDIPATLVRIPGTPASAAYASDAYALTRDGKHVTALFALKQVFQVVRQHFEHVNNAELESAVTGKLRCELVELGAGVDAGAIE